MHLLKGIFSFGVEPKSLCGNKRLFIVSAVWGINLQGSLLWILLSNCHMQELFATKCAINYGQL